MEMWLWFWELEPKSWVLPHPGSDSEVGVLAQETSEETAQPFPDSPSEPRGSGEQRGGAVRSPGSTILGTCSQADIVLKKIKFVSS